MNKKLNIIPLSEIQPAVDVDINDLVNVYKICLQLKELCNRKKGIGISAVQAGIFQKIFLINLSGIYRYFINCDYTPDGEEKILHLEGCLSLVNSSGKLKTYEVDRFSQILISGFELLDDSELVCNELKDYPISGFPAAVFQHEIDHSYGRARMIDVIGREVGLRIKNVK